MPAKKDALSELIGNHHTAIVCGLEVKFRIAKTSERIKLLDKYPIKEQKKVSESQMGQKLDKIERWVAEVFSTLHQPSAKVTKRTISEWVEVLLFAQTDNKTKYGDFSTALEFAMAILGARLPEMDEEQVALLKKGGANPT